MLQGKNMSWQCFEQLVGKVVRKFIFCLKIKKGIGYALKGYDGGVIIAGACCCLHIQSKKSIGYVYVMKANQCCKKSKQAKNNSVAGTRNVRTFIKAECKVFELSYIKQKKGLPIVASYEDEQQTLALNR